MRFTDQTGFEIDLPRTPERIISLVPSQTELLSYLKLEEATAGITRYCIRPAAWQQQKAIVGGTKQFNFEKIDELRPDLIIGNKEENYETGIELLRKRFAVWLSDVNSVKDALSMIETVGAMCNRHRQAHQLSADINERLPVQAPKRSHVRIAYFIWRKPYMVAASGTFIHDMLVHAGFENVFADLKRYPEVTPQMLNDAKPDFILLSSEPYHFTQTHFAEFSQMCPSARVLFVDGEMFSWYGPRMLLAADYFEQLRRLISRG